MITAHIHQALAQVQELKMRVLNAQRFTGYSGRCRAAGGTVALLAPLIMTASFYPQTTTAHLWGWGLVFLIALLGNYSAVLYWYLYHPDVKRDLRRLMPTVDALPSIAVGGILSLALILKGQHDLLFGVWMCLYGLTNLSARQTLPKALWPLGIFFILCGSYCLLQPFAFTNPWPMGLIFGIGEWIGGFIFYRNNHPQGTVTNFINGGDNNHDDT